MESPKKPEGRAERMKDTERAFERYREKFRLFYDAIASDHRESARQHRGHGLDHDVTVAQLAALIAPDERTAEKAWCAGMLHSTDRYANVAQVSEGAHEVGESIRETVQYLPQGYFSAEELNDIYTASALHDELNHEGHGLTQMALMDADRLVNLMSSVVIRAGQFNATIPALEFEYLDKSNPESTYHAPKSVLDDLRTNLSEYIPKLRLPKAKEMGEKLQVRLEQFIRNVEEETAELGLNGVKL